MFGRSAKSPSVSVPDLHYRALVARARQPFFYRELGVPDTVEGRFDLIVLHLVLLVRRLSKEGEIGSALAQEVFDLFIRDMDRSIREMGVSDLGMKRRMRDVARSFYGRAEAYSGPLDADDRVELAKALHRNFFPEESQAAGASRLASQVEATVAALAATTRDELLSGEAFFGVLEPTLAPAPA
jgi:cytochrome b pre-mRNA-processing protein 3